MTQRSLECVAVRALSPRRPSRLISHIRSVYLGLPNDNLQKARLRRGRGYPNIYRILYICDSEECEWVGIVFEVWNVEPSVAESRRCIFDFFCIFSIPREKFEIMVDDRTVPRMGDERSQGGFSSSSHRSRDFRSRMGEVSQKHTQAEEGGTLSKMPLLYVRCAIKSSFPSHCPAPSLANPSPSVYGGGVGTALFHLTPPQRTTARMLPVKWYLKIGDFEW